MPRIRSIHPGFWTDEALVGVSAFARLMFLGLGNESDDKGTFEWKPLTLKMRIFPVDNLDIDALLVELIKAGAIMQYEIAGKTYGAVRNFTKYQRPKKPNNIHPITPEAETYVGLKAVSSPPVPHQFPTSGEKPIQMEEGGDKGRVEEKKEAAKAASVVPISETPEAELYRRGADLLGKTSGGLITRARKAMGDDRALALVIQSRAKHDPKQWFAGAVARAEKPEEAPPDAWVTGAPGARSF